MIYQVGGKITSKKPHACGGNEWTITRTGADVKVTCDRCGKSLFLSVDQVKKMAKKYVEGTVDGDR